MSSGARGEGSLHGPEFLKRQSTIGVEVEGPHSFVGRSQQPQGKTLLKRRQLQAAGWRLMGVRVPS